MSRQTHIAAGEGEELATDRNKNKVSFDRPLPRCISPSHPTTHGCNGDVMRVC